MHSLPVMMRVVSVRRCRRVRGNYEAGAVKTKLAFRKHHEAVHQLTYSFCTFTDTHTHTRARARPRLVMQTDERNVWVARTAYAHTHIHTHLYVFPPCIFLHDAGPRHFTCICFCVCLFASSRMRKKGSDSKQATKGLSQNNSAKRTCKRECSEAVGRAGEGFVAVVARWW